MPARNIVFVCLHAAWPTVSVGFAPAWDFITGSVDRLLERMPAATR